MSNDLKNLEWIRKRETECERIVREGVLPVDFFKPETICDFYVDENRKKIWGILLDLLVKFDAICKKYDLKYSLAFGSLLGAVRHHGFIPWDDDMDVCMPRADYERFIELAPKELGEPYFLQIPGKDHGYYYSWAKLRNSRTTGLSYKFMHAGFNQGQYLDIFVIDNALLDTYEQDYNQVKQLILENSANMLRLIPKPTENDLARMCQFEYRDPLLVLKEMNTICRKYETMNTEYVMVSALSIYPAKSLIYKKTDIEEVINVNLYGYDFYVLKNYDIVLSCVYGDYMKFPPVNERGRWHESMLYNADVPYTEKIKELTKEDNKLS